MSPPASAARRASVAHRMLPRADRSQRRSARVRPSPETEAVREHLGRAFAPPETIPERLVRRAPRPPRRGRVRRQVLVEPSVHLFLPRGRSPSLRAPSSRDQLDDRVLAAEVKRQGKGAGVPHLAGRETRRSAVSLRFGAPGAGDHARWRAGGRQVFGSRRSATNSPASYGAVSGRVELLGAGRPRGPVRAAPAVGQLVSQGERSSRARSSRSWSTNRLMVRVTSLPQSRP